jgi:hypothetical protein
VLKLSDSHTGKSIFENRFLEQLKREVKNLGPQATLKMENLIRKALEVLNHLASLSMIDEGLSTDY